MYKILVVGGIFNEDYLDDFTSGYMGLIKSTDYNKSIQTNSLHHTYGKCSKKITKLIEQLIPYSKLIKFHNGGKLSDLKYDLEETKNFDIVYWFANVNDNQIDIDKITTNFNNLFTCNF